MGGEVLILVNIPNSHFLLSLTHSALMSFSSTLSFLSPYLQYWYCYFCRCQKETILIQALLYLRTHTAVIVVTIIIFFNITILITSVIFIQALLSVPSDCRDGKRASRRLVGSCRLLRAGPKFVSVFF